MQIESIIKRAKGTEVVLDRTRYHFKPIDPSDEFSPHICSVTNPEHARMLLAVTEGYRVYIKGAEPAAPRIVAPRAPTGGGTILPPITLAEEDEQVGKMEAEALRQEAIASAQRDSVEAAENLRRLNEGAATIRSGDHDDTFLPGAEGDEEGEGDDDGDDGEPGKVTEESLSAMSDDALRTFYKELFNVDPKGMRRATMQKAILKATT